MTKPKVFLSYARPDELTVSEIYRFLQQNDCIPWMDVYNLLPGQDWEYEIETAIENSDYLIVCLSTNSVDRTGYAQAELKKALKAFEYIPEGKIYLIPVRLDDCPVPRSLRKQNWLDWFDINARPKLIKTLTGAVPQTPKPPNSLKALHSKSNDELNALLTLHQQNNAQVESIFATGLIYLSLGSFTMAKALIEKVVQIQPANAYAWYTLAIANLEGKQPWSLTYEEAILVQSQALKATQLDSRLAQAFLLLAIIKDDFFKSKGFAIEVPDIHSCFKMALQGTIDKVELNYLLKLVSAPDSELIPIIRNL